MPTLQQLIRNRATVTIPTDDPNDPLVVTYQPAAITPRLEVISTELRGREDVTRKEQMELMTEYLTAVVHAWNLNEPDGAPLPVIPATIAALDYEAKVILFAGITEHAYPGEANGASVSTPLPSGTPQQAKQATSRRRSQTGTR